MANAWDRILLIVSLIALAAVSACFGFLSGSNSETNKTQPGPSAKPVKAVDNAKQQDQINIWLQPRIWEESDKDHQLFTGRKYLFFASKKSIELYTPNLLIDGLPVSWIEKYALNIKDVFIGHRDTDGDGFTNIDEFKDGTSPNDPASHPLYTTIMRMKSYNAKKYRIKFQNKSELEGEDVYQLATPDGSKKSRILKKNATFDSFKIIDYEVKSKTPEPPDFESDISELHLLNEKTGVSITLAYNKEQDVPEVSLSFVLLTPTLINQPVTCKVGDEFTLGVNASDPAVPTDNRYKLLKADANSATVTDLTNHRDVVIPLFKESDTDLVAKVD